MEKHGKHQKHLSQRIKWYHPPCHYMLFGNTPLILGIPLQTPKKSRLHRINGMLKVCEVQVLRIFELFFAVAPRKLGTEIPILTFILFRWVGSTTNQTKFSLFFITSIFSSFVNPFQFSGLMNYGSILLGSLWWIFQDCIFDSPGIFWREICAWQIPWRNLHLKKGWELERGGCKSWGR